tara:strand:- start:33037 stop:33678 length:642 start_codon:yes stop_codon:yes gene_type:complete
MSTLLAIEESFLSQSDIKSALNLNDIKRIQKQITNAHKSKFGHTLTMAKLVVGAESWFTSEEGQTRMADEGLSWTKEEFGQRVFGWQRSFFYKVLKAGKLSDQIINAFSTKCDEADAQGKDVDRSLAGLLKFAQDFNDVETIINEETGEEEEIEGLEEAEVEERVETIFTLSMKNATGRNVAVRVDANGAVITRNDASEIMQALAFLQAAMSL